jgi:hypothetical protein
VPPDDPSDVRQRLTQAVTRLGFPDLDLTTLFTESVPTSEIDRLLERLNLG